MRLVDLPDDVVIGTAGPKDDIRAEIDELDVGAIRLYADREGRCSAAPSC